MDRSYSITVGRPKGKRVSTEQKFGSSTDFHLAESLVEKTRNYWPYMAICGIGACLIS
jgi:hypothetical protein